MTEAYNPSNAYDLSLFIEYCCSTCARDALLNGTKTEDTYQDADLCPIFNRITSGRSDAPEWHKDGDSLFCDGFEPMPGQPQDTLTADMFTG
jgi:hypothetical protein